MICLQPLSANHITIDVKLLDRQPQEQDLRAFIEHIADHDASGAIHPAQLGAEWDNIVSVPVPVFKIAG